ncbi:MAG: T9SS type A sorting domain-containing protein [Chitinophagales bacterium]|nr:T9SS type A sorting domain-containing protein [Chitinophagales bacterium]
MKRLLTLFSICLYFISYSQTPAPCNAVGSVYIPESSCYQACVPCDGIDQGIYTNNYNNFGIITSPPPDFCAQAFDNFSYLAFVAGTPQITFEIMASNCIMGNGLQIGIYEALGCQIWNPAITCSNQLIPGIPTVFDAYGLTPGQVYYFVIDGFLGDFCDIAINVLNGSTLPPPLLVEDLEIIGPAIISCGTSATFNVLGVSGATGYRWELNGSLIGITNLPVMDVILPQEGIHELCVTPFSVCEGDGVGECAILEAVPPPIVTIEETLCEQDFPYFLPNGMVFFTPGTYTYTEILPNGCEQIYLLILNMYPPIMPTIIDIEICEGDAYDLGGVAYTSPGNYTADFVAANGCDSLVFLNLGILSSDFTDLDTISGSEYLLVGDSLLSAPGAFEVLLTNQYGCDSLVAGYFDLFANDSIWIDSTLCAGDTLFIEMDTLTSSGVYTYDIVNNNVFDTLLHYTLTFLDAPYTLLMDTICQGESFIVGDSVYTETGTYVNTFAAANGCDSTLTLELFVLQPMDTLQVSICAGESYVLGEEVYDVTGIYMDTLFGSTGCQSIIQLELEVYDPVETILNDTICEGLIYSFAGQVLNSTGLYIDSLIAQNGCDSIVSLNLFATPAPVVSLIEMICPGSEIIVGGISYSQPDDYVIELSTQSGCDSIVELSLSWYDASADTLMLSICEGDTLTSGNNLYTEAGVYDEAYINSNGCDSLLTIILDVIPIDTNNLEVTICEGDTYSVAGNVYSTTGIYEIWLTSMQTGCDSLIILDLTVLPTSYVVVDTMLCEGDVFPVGGDILDQPGTYTFAFVSEYGCDSIVDIIITIIPTIYVSLIEEICEGEVYIVGEEEYIESGMYENILTSSLGCDSVVLLTLNVIPVEMGAIDTTICHGDIFEIGSYTFTDTVDNFLQFPDSNGCGSIVHLQLSFYEEITLEDVQIEADVFGGLADGSILVELTGGTPPYSYLWSTGGVSNTIDFLEAGEYFLIVTDAHGCQEGFYFTVPLDPGFLPEDMLARPDGFNMEVMPNPFNKRLEIIVSEPVELRLFDMMGQVVYRQATEDHKVNIYPDLPSGVYWLVAFRGGEVIEVEKVVKLR